ncbi:hypothetical protein BDQ12DRAFT_730012 [Crucibulum laeve]|uniref:Uncharacterized protein n=1 Tax=Crucibulum laeve TaxID=68775 RepID=A0A5C3LDW5_9AGAR|nr:hypothetical protein BDQ12DRAFT_730012 [Crucibulum laeve]
MASLTSIAKKLAVTSILTRSLTAEARYPVKKWTISVKRISSGEKIQSLIRFAAVRRDAHRNRHGNQKLSSVIRVHVQNRYE